MAAVAIRVPSVEALFDAWSPEPLARRPLNDEARSRIVDAWIEASKRKRHPDGLELTLPAGERAEGLEQSILAAIRRDMEAMRVDARHHWIRRAVAPRESRIGFLVFISALVVAGLIDYGSEEGSLSTMLSQTFVVLAWVALWGPAYRLMTSASWRLGRRSFAEIAEAEIEIRWA
ncbi:MAG TPA: hypothetical protein VGI73_11795 [Solirubrobacterales bacterium]|jgi:hypothetical protein